MPGNLNKVALVVPTCRENSFREFLAAWEPVRFWDLLVVVQDSHEATFAVPDGALHACWKSIDGEFGTDAWIFSRRDSAIRSAGFLLAHRAGADLVVTLDDDTRPVAGQDFLGEHRRAIEQTEQWTPAIPGYRTRGLPYLDRGRLTDVHLSVGLWCGVPDLDAPQSLAAGCPTDYVPPDGRWLLPARQYAPICGMNLAFTREFAPLAYFPLMGESQPYRRFDDIWFGIIAKKICDHLGWSISVGRPWVEHRRASDVLANLVKEAPGIGMNEWIWRVVDLIQLKATDARSCMTELGTGLELVTEPYTSKLGRAMKVWAGMFGQ